VSRAHAARAAAVHAIAPPYPLAPLSASALSVVPPSKPFTRAALSARRLSRRGLGLSLCRRVEFTTALPLGVSLSQTPHRAQADCDSVACVVMM